MFDSEFTIDTNSKATLVSMTCPKMENYATPELTKKSLDEMVELLRTLGVATTETFVQNKKTVDPATIIGVGKLEEIAISAKEHGSELLVLDFELTAGQIKNIREVTKMAVVDRCHVILEIFAKHARTKEAKIQIEIARLEYILPRLTGFWSHLSRQKGGIGVMSGEGEKQIELDRRIIKDRIKFFKQELEDVIVSREQQRKKRQNKAITAALIGYTNTGKSSIMNRLCHVNILEEDKLFATLDATYRTLNPDTKPPMILIDTVGFISNLPNTLIDGFKTTLESAIEADLLLIVCDISSPNYQDQLEVTKRVMKELGVDKKDQLIIFNKKDKLDNWQTSKIISRVYPNSFVVSSYDEEDMNKLQEHIINFFLSKQSHYDIFIPYELGNLHSVVITNTNIINRENHEKGIFYRLSAPDFIFNNLGLSNYILAPNDPIRQEKKVD